MRTGGLERTKLMRGQTCTRVLRPVIIKERRANVNGAGPSIVFGQPGRRLATMLSPRCQLPRSIQTPQSCVQEVSKKSNEPDLKVNIIFKTPNYVVCVKILLEVFRN